MTGPPAYVPFFITPEDGGRTSHRNDVQGPAEKT